MKTNKNKRRNKNIVKQNDLDNSINPQEAQNVSESNERLSGNDAKQASNKLIKVCAKKKNIVKIQKDYSRK